MDNQHRPASISTGFETPKGVTRNHRDTPMTEKAYPLSQLLNPLHGFLTGLLQVFHSGVAIFITETGAKSIAGGTSVLGEGDSLGESCVSDHLRMHDDMFRESVVWAAKGRLLGVPAIRWVYLLRTPIRVVRGMNVPLIIRKADTGPSALLTEWPVELDAESIWFFPTEMGILVVIHRVSDTLQREQWRDSLWYARHLHYFLEVYQDTTYPDIFSLYPLIIEMENKDPFMAGHSMKVASFAAQLAARIGMPMAETRRIYVGALLHDLGKVEIPNEILLKPGRLNDEEYRHIQTHPVIGAEYLSRWPQLTVFRDIVRHHHERIDGKGYPDGLKRDDISLSVRIVSLVDAFDAMTSRRAYRSAFTREQAMLELRAGSGTQFDETLVTVFEHCLNQSPYQLSIR
ncbi:HD-GYP domain-containing protein [Alicyclobacillus ferrooxydans]|nr:HD-GYP domain-containing protein [Alicyclobacillus ferrooxydans]